MDFKMELMVHNFHLRPTHRVAATHSKHVSAPAFAEYDYMMKSSLPISSGLGGAMRCSLL
jgi:hypothetical protein